MFIKRISVLFLVLLLFSCADPSIFDDNSSDIAVYTVKSGGLQEYGTPLKVTLDYGEESPEFDTLEITVFSDSGIILCQETVPAINIESKKSRKVDLPSDCSRGLYHVKIRLLKSGLKVFEESRSFFYDEDQYSLESIMSYPPDPVPGEKIIVKADYTSPDFSNPWFRWTVDDKIVAEGFASANGNTAALDLNSSNGVIVVAVEMFPFKPAESGFDDFISFFKNEAAVFVSDKNRERSNEFEESVNYLSLFHFRGEILDEGVIALNYPGKSSVSIAGNPELDFKNSFYGYTFSNDKYVTADYEIDILKESREIPMTIRMRMLPDREALLMSESGSSRFPVVETVRSGNIISVGLENSLGFYLDIESGSGNFESICDYIPGRGGEILDLALNFYQKSNKTDVVWIINGKTIKTDTVPFNAGLNGTDSLSCRIGGSDVLIDEAGIYFRDNEGEYSVDSSLFSSIMKKRFNGDFAAADGFDYSESETEAESGICSFESGFLYIEPESSIAVFKDLELFDPVEISTAGEADIIIKNSYGKTVLESSVSDTNPVGFNPSETDSSNFSIYLANSSRNKTFKIDNILITVKYPDIPDSE